MHYSIYIKTHARTHVKYLGVARGDPYEHVGSSYDWLDHIQAYGDEVDTEVIWTGDDFYEMSSIGKRFALMFDVVGSSEYINRAVTDGKDIEEQMGHAEWVARDTLYADLGIKSAPRAHKVYDEDNPHWTSGQLWWHNTKTGVHCREAESPGPDWALGNLWQRKVNRTQTMIDAHTKSHVGMKHSDETKKKISDKRKIMVDIVNTTTGRRSRVYPDNIPEGWIEGYFPPGPRIRKIRVHDPVTKQRKFLEEDKIPSGWKLGWVNVKVASNANGNWKPGRWIKKPKVDKS